MTSILRGSVVGLLALSAVSCGSAEMRGLFGKSEGSPPPQKPYHSICKIRCPDGTTRDLVAKTYDWSTPYYPACSPTSAFMIRSERMAACGAAYPAIHDCSPWELSKEKTIWVTKCKVRCPDGRDEVVEGYPDPDGHYVPISVYVAACPEDPYPCAGCTPWKEGHPGQ